MKRLFALLFLIALLAGCAPAGDNQLIFDNPYAPGSGDKSMQRDEIEIQSAQVASTRSLPPQILIMFTYMPPTVCHQLRVSVSKPDAQNRILVDAYGVVERDQACILMMPLSPQQASLNIGSFPDGDYTVWLNGQQIGEFNSLNP